MAEEAVRVETPAPPAGGEGQPPEMPAPSQDDKTMAMLAHLLGGLLSFLVPLIIWLVKKDQSPFVATEAKEALNFQLVMLIGYIVLGTITCGFGWPIVWIVSIIFGILGGMQAKEGKNYRYPFNIRMVK
ncbi:MAG: DUF4870 domain-containing protein [Lentisphaeria bacterium]|jgi:hypothetical protein